MLGLVSNESPKKHLLGIVNKQINLDHPAAYFLFTRQSIPSVPQGPFYFGKRNWKVRKLMIYFWEVSLFVEVPEACLYGYCQRDWLFHQIRHVPNNNIIVPLSTQGRKNKFNLHLWLLHRCLNKISSFFLITKSSKVLVFLYICLLVNT